MAKIMVLGSGGWGIALAISAFSNGNDVKLWTPFEEEAESLIKTHTSEKLLKGVVIPDEIGVTTDISEANEYDMVILAVPSFAVEETAQKLASAGYKNYVVNVAKGLQKDTGKRLSEVIKEKLPECEIVVLSGPSHAEEVARKEPTSLVSASESMKAAEYVQQVMMSDTLRVYTNDDVVGVELGGAFKNIIAVAAGICDGLNLGDNPKAALITRGLSEIARLGVKLGARSETFAGLTGLGDLIVTCTSVHSRNHRFGDLIGRGVSVKEALNMVGTVEGYHACGTAHILAMRENVEMPICGGVYEALYNNLPVESLIKALMTRPGKEEHESSWLTKNK